MVTRTVLGGFVLATLVALGAIPAGAMKPPPVIGTIGCATSSTSVTFSPALKYKQTIDGPSRGRGPSTATWSAQLGSCAGSGGPAPGGIDHGTFAATDKIAGSHCEGTYAMKFAATITWFRADETVVGTSRLSVATSLDTSSFYGPVMLQMTATAKPMSSVAPGEKLSASFSSEPSWAYSGACFKTELPAMAFDDSTMTIAPA